MSAIMIVVVTFVKINYIVTVTSLAYHKTQQSYKNTDTIDLQVAALGFEVSYYVGDTTLGKCIFVAYLVSRPNRHLIIHNWDSQLDTACI